MAIQKTNKKVYLKVEFDGGKDETGKPIVNRKKLSYVNKDLALEDMDEVCDAIGELTKEDILNVVLLEENDLVEQA